MSSVMRSVDTRFWTDPWVLDLSIKESYVFLYLLTNRHSSWCGVYELAMYIMSVETKIDRKELENEILPKLAPKIIYMDGWVCILNFEKYHNNKSEQVRKGIENAWNGVPDKIKKKLGSLRVSIDPLLVVPSSSSSSSSSLALASSSSSTDKKRTFKKVSETEKERTWRKDPGSPTGHITNFLPKI